MDYEKMNRSELLERIEELEILNRQLLDEKEQEAQLDFSWTGNLGHWYWNIKTNNVTFNPLKIKALGFTEDEIPDKVDYQFFTDLIHPDDYINTMNDMKDHLYGRKSVYETEYRIRNRNGKYRWFYDRGRITRYDSDDKPLFLAGIVFDITDKKEKMEEIEEKNIVLEELSYMDSLTGIHNRRSVLRYLDECILDYKYTKTPLSIAMFDIDDFKMVNDKMGHVFGDIVLTDVAAVIKSSIRDNDMAARFGGEEFIVIFPGTDSDKAALVCERIRTGIQQLNYENYEGITISCGVKGYTGESVNDFINGADVKLYTAKKTGKNKVVY